NNANFSSVILKQIGVGIGLGLIFLFLAYKIHYTKWKKFAVPIFIFSFLLTALVFVPMVGFEHGGAKRWLVFGPVSFQPSEFLKFGFILYLASWISSRKKEINSFKFGFIPFLIITGFVGVLLVLEPDLGTLGVIAITSLAMFFVGGGKFSQVAIAVFLGMALLGGLVLIKPHAMSRVMVFMDPSYDPQGIGYQLRQSMIAIGSGGISGRGFGMSVQKFNYLPEPIGDSVFAVFAEEFGFAGSLFLIGLFLLFLYRGLFIASRAPDSFSGLFAFGIVILIVTQSFINIGSMIGILPLTGLPLIFVSQGGSALVVTLAEIGILLNISKYSS
ncbi:MAG: cell division protein FtsW, partial [bacterium]|nr:cell division protein FtsW [bacterium]